MRYTPPPMSTNGRDYKSFFPGGYFHVYNRGVAKQEIFLDDQDYNNFLKRCRMALNRDFLQEINTRIRVTPLPSDCITIATYCLMPNHFHFLIRQENNISIDKYISRVCSSYTKYFNKKYNRVGGLFEDQFKAKLVDTDSYLQYVSAYIHNNPVSPMTYPYSSLAEYLNPMENSLSDPSLILQLFDNNIADYLRFMKDVGPESADIAPNVFDEDED